MLHAQLKQQGHDLNNKLQVILGYLELGQPEKALVSARAAIALARQVGAGIQACACA
jgi:sensor histidine kinase regulating citrate/malate metabolism